MVIDAGMTVIGVVGQFVSMAVHVAGCSSMPIVSMAVRAGGELSIGGE
jgi:hypothetical protein